MAILVYIENTDGVLKKSAFEVASYAKAIADQKGDTLVALSIGDVADAELQKLGKYGVTKVLNASQANLKQFVNKAYAAIIAAAAKQEQASVVVLSNSFSGKGLAPPCSRKIRCRPSRWRNQPTKLEWQRYGGEKRQPSPTKHLQRKLSVPQ